MNTIEKVKQEFLTILATKCNPVFEERHVFIREAKKSEYTDALIAMYDKQPYKHLI